MKMSKVSYHLSQLNMAWWYWWMDALLSYLWLCDASYSIKNMTDWSYANPCEIQITVELK